MLPSYFIVALTTCLLYKGYIDLGDGPSLFFLMVMMGQRLGLARYARFKPLVAFAAHRSKAVFII